MKATTLVYTAIAGIVLYLFYKKRPKIEQATAEDKGGGSTGGALGGFKPSNELHNSFRRKLSGLIMEVNPIDTQLGGFKPSKEVKPIDTQLGGFKPSKEVKPIDTQLGGFKPSKYFVSDVMHPLIRSSIDTQLGLSTPIGVVISPVEAMPVKIRLDDSLAVTNNY